jgi:hypothetical protein
MFAPIAWSGASMDEAGWATHGHDVAVGVWQKLAVFRCIAHTAVAQHTQLISGSHFMRGCMIAWWVLCWKEAL